MTLRDVLLRFLEFPAQICNQHLLLARYRGLA